MTAAEGRLLTLIGAVAVWLGERRGALTPFFFSLFTSTSTTTDTAARPLSSLVPETRKKEQKEFKRKRESAEAFQ
jgi:hypothetical protein